MLCWGHKRVWMRQIVPSGVGVLSCSEWSKENSFLQALEELRPQKKLWAIFLSPLVVQQREFAALHKVPSMSVGSTWDLDLFHRLPVSHGLLIGNRAAHYECHSSLAAHVAGSKWELHLQLCSNKSGNFQMYFASSKNAEVSVVKLINKAFLIQWSSARLAFCQTMSHIHWHMWPL